jgi:hypothetical protein
MLKLFLMTKNEIELLEDWLKYHGYLFGLENIYVLDGSDDERVFEIYQRYKPLGLNVYHSSTGLNGLGRELTQLMHAHKGVNNFLIKLDTDEFLAYTRDFALSPLGLLALVLKRIYPRGKVLRWISGNLMNLMYRNKELYVDNFSQFFAELPVTGQRYKVSLTTWSIPRKSAVPNICRDLTEFTPLQFTHIKSFFHSDSFVSVDLGGHNGASTNNYRVIDTGLTLIHYHSTSVDDSARRAKQVLLSHKYIDAEDSIMEQRDKLQAIKSDSYVPSFHKINFYLQYLDSLEGGKPIDPTILNSEHPYFRQTGPVREMTLVRDTLNMIDSNEIFSL